MAAMGALAVHHQSPEEKLKMIQNERMNDIRKLGQALDRQGGANNTNATVINNNTSPTLPIPPSKSKPNAIKYISYLFSSVFLNPLYFFISFLSIT